MKRLLVVFTLCLSIGLPVLAQESTEEVQPSPTEPSVIAVVEPSQDEPIEVPQDTSVVLIDEAENPALLIVLAIVSVIAVVAVGGIAVMARQLGRSISPEVMAELRYARPRIEERVDQGFDRLDEIAGRTTNPLDDIFSRYTREQAQRIINAFYDTEGTPPPTPEEPPSQPPV